MARYTGPACRLCRREGEKLFLKGDRCFSTKCAIDRREGQPGQHPKLRGRLSEFKLQLREKQKLKRMYGLLERPFRHLFHTSEMKKGITGENLLLGLESRIDNMVYRAGFAGSRRAGRQLVRHGHFLVNGQKVSMPSYQLKPGDVVSLIEASHSNPHVNEALNKIESRRVPEWLELSRENYQVSIKALPKRSQLTHPMKEQLVVELYSK